MKQGYLGQQIWPRKVHFAERRALLQSLNSLKKLKHRQRGHVKTIGQILGEVILFAQEVRRGCLHRQSRTIQTNGKSVQQEGHDPPPCPFRRIFERTMLLQRHEAEQGGFPTTRPNAVPATAQWGRDMMVAPIPCSGKGKAHGLQSGVLTTGWAARSRQESHPPCHPFPPSVARPRRARRSPPAWRAGATSKEGRTSPRVPRLAPSLHSPR